MKERTERRGEELHRSQSQLSLLRCMRGEKRAACATEFGSRVARRDQNLKGLHSRSPRCNHVGHFGERSGTITTLYTESLTVHREYQLKGSLNALFGHEKEVLVIK